MPAGLVNLRARSSDLHNSSGSSTDTDKFVRVRTYVCGGSKSSSSMGDSDFKTGRSDVTAAKRFEAWHVNRNAYFLRIKWSIARSRHV